MKLPARIANLLLPLIPAVVLFAQSPAEPQPLYTPQAAGRMPAPATKASLSPATLLPSPALKANIAGSGSLVLNFDSLQCGEPVGNYYAGGTGGYGTGPGPNFGITFSSNALAALDHSVCSDINATNEPSYPGILYFLSGSAATMNVPAGFTGGFSFYYSPPSKTGFINVWSGPNATGTLLTSLTLPTTNRCSSLAYCNWIPIGVSFAGVAQSVDFGGTENYIGFDSITLGAAVVVNPGKAAGNSAEQPGGCACGDPVSVGTGNLFESVVDYSTRGANPLQFIRYYNSFSGQTAASTLGINWRSNFDRYLRLNSPGSVTAERPDGRQVNFTLSGSSWLPDSDVDITLVNTANTWTLTDENDSSESYTVSGSAPPVLQTIRSRNGYIQTLKYGSSGQLASVTDSYGRMLSLTYSNGLLKQTTTPEALVLSYSFSSGNPQLTTVAYSTTPATSITYLYENYSLPLALTGYYDENGNRFATWTYDSQGRVLTSQHSGGAELTTFSYDDSNGSRTVTNALGLQTIYRFSTLQGVSKLTEIDRVASTTAPAAKQLFTYDANGFLASRTDWNGNLTTYLNNAHGLPTLITEASGSLQARSTVISYDSTWAHLPALIVTAGLKTAFTYDSDGNLVTRTLTDTTSGSVPYSTAGQTRIWTNTWSNSLLASTLGPRGDVKGLTSYSYDSTGALISVTNALGQATKVTQHTPGGLPQTLVDANGVTTNLTYDARLRLVSSAVTTATGVMTTKYSWDAAGNLLTTTLPDGSALTNTYDQAHRVTSVSDLLHQSIAYTLDAMGNRIQTAVADASSRRQRLHSAVFDTVGRAVQDVGGMGQAFAYAYDSYGNTVSATDPLRHTASLSYDSLNRPVQSVDAAGNSTFTSYDAHDRPVSVTDPNGGTTTYTYNGFGDLIQQASPVSGTTVYRYDPAGNLTQRVDARGVTANYTYDALDRQLTVSYPGSSAENITYNYDQAGHGFGIGRLTSLTDAAGTLSRSYDERGDVLLEKRVAGTTTLTTSYSYNAAQRIVSVVYPSGATASYSRDAMGRTTGISVQAPASSAKPAVIVSAIAYQPFGPPNSITYANGVTETRTFDADYRETSRTDAGKIALQKLAWSYDSGNNVLGITDSVTTANTQSFGYDSLNRLTSASGAYGKLSYIYDAIGNRVLDSSTATFPALDGLGTMTSLTYNQTGRVSAVAAGSQQLAGYSYDAFGHRLARTGTSAALYQYDLSGHLIEETDGQGNAQADYIYLGNQPVATFAPASGKIYSLFTDRLGTPQIATDSSQTVMWQANYQPFGATNTGVGLITQDLRLPGQEFDSVTGWNHNGFREYIPGLGRYAHADPTGLAGGHNLFGYAGQSPIGAIDPSGLSCFAVGGTVTCSAPNGGPTVSFPRPLGWPNLLGAGDLSYHHYNIQVPVGCRDAESTMQAIINNPTPGSPSPATSGGTPNDATPSYISPILNLIDVISSFGDDPSGDYNPVISYLTVDMNTGQPVVVNVTQPGHFLFPGYVARTVTQTTMGTVVNNVGEGTGVLQAPYSPFGGYINNVWMQQTQSILK